MGDLEGELALLCNLRGAGELRGGQPQGGAQGVKGGVVLDEDAPHRLLLQQAVHLLQSKHLTNLSLLLSLSN